MATKRRLSLEDINRRQISMATETNLAHVSRIFNPNHPHWPSLTLARKMACYLGVDVEELCRFLEEDLGKEPARTVGGDSSDGNT